MAPALPYTYFSCPCVDTSAPASRGHGEGHAASAEDAEKDDERTFDPRAPRSNYSLYPLEHLLYCEDCHQIRCPRCVLDEIVCWFCPSCLFEVASSTVKSDGNRCTRSCYQCPVCTSPLMVNAMGSSEDGATQEGPYILGCPYCDWSSLDVGMNFHKPNNITGQLADLRKGSSRLQNSVKQDEDDTDTEITSMDPAKQFANLKSFYISQLAEPSSAGPSLDLPSSYAYGSPGNLSRIMGLYTGVGYGPKKQQSKPGMMREAYGMEEGCRVLGNDDDEVIERIKDLGWDETTSLSQRTGVNGHAKFLSDVYPVATLLRTKRSKRCRACRHILVKPESKVQSTRFRIRLVAANYVPAITLSPLSVTTLPSSMTPGKPTQTLLTFRNPLFDTITVTLATPTLTPGRIASAVTILCPQFTVGANTDVWDEALGSGGSKEKRRTKAETSEGHQAEAGKVWERGRNWTSVVVEVKPGYLSQEAGDEDEDDDICEIPVFVRVEYETEGGPDADDKGGGKRDTKGEREKRELAYWCVLGVGRIAGGKRDGSVG
ncbi:MAG: hypothetical protein M1832_003207 [Thelocarpon impressellum]|nr:MAG: hypothetical protein M1832_003207 [Thelocarpon impressellum]